MTSLLAPPVSLPGAMTDVQAFIVIIWLRDADTEGEWLFYDFTEPAGSTLTELEWGKAYTIVVTEDCTWTLPH